MREFTRKGEGEGERRGEEGIRRAEDRWVISPCCSLCAYAEPVGVRPYPVACRHLPIL